MARRYSIITKDLNTCFLCGRRKLADEDRLTVGLCHRCHMLLHDKGNFDRELQKIGQKTWMEHYHKTINDFIDRFGKSYL